LPEKVKNSGLMLKKLACHVIVAIALPAALFLLAGCGDEEENTATSTTTTTAEKLTPEDIYLPPPSLPPGRSPDPETAESPVNDSLQMQLETILSTYNLNYQYSIIAELASDRYEGRKTGSDGARAAAAFIAREYSRLGLVPWTDVGLDSYRHHFNLDGNEDDNIIGILPGNNPSGRIVILSAHYDHLGLDDNGEAYNGADDNAAGIGTVMEAAALLQSLGYRPANTIVFCAFSGEEQGQYGAQSLGRLITDSGLAGRVEVINVDGIGATGGNYFGVWDQDAAIAGPLVESMRQAGLYLGVTVINEGTDIGSDAQPFDWDYGIPAITVDWDWGSNPSVYHPNYHTIYDDAEAIDKPTLARATQVILVGLWLRAAT
jgi:hypothetical protein